MMKNRRNSCKDRPRKLKKRADAKAVRGSLEKRVGLARAVSKLGYCSRSRAAELIRAGRVRLNDGLRRDPETPVNLGEDRIEIDGAPLRAETKTYLVLNKPRGIVTTADDEKGRDTVYSLLPAGLPWLAPVGRLDMASEGLLLLTNDSEWAGRITAPETHLDKIYHVQIGALAEEGLTRQLETGFVVADGEALRVKHAEILRSGEKNSWLEITLDEGRNRHIRRMFEQRGIEVLRLIRVAIGPLAIANLPKGATRTLTPTEKLSIDRAMQRGRETRA